MLYAYIGSMINDKNIYKIDNDKSRNINGKTIL